MVREGGVACIQVMGCAPSAGERKEGQDGDARLTSACPSAERNLLKVPPLRPHPLPWAALGRFPFVRCAATGPFPRAGCPPRRGGKLHVVANARGVRGRPCLPPAPVPALISSCPPNFSCTSPLGGGRWGLVPTLTKWMHPS